MLSLPERLGRIVVGAGAGTLKGIAELALPEAVRQTKLYQVLLARNLRYLIEEIGDVEDVYVQDPPARSRYVARKFVGNFIELAGLLTMRASPVWLLALVSDVSGGTKTFLRELVEELKREGLLDAAARVDSADDLLDRVQSLTSGAADTIDTPPLSVEELRETLAFLRREASSKGLGRLLPEAELGRLWEGMKETARVQRRSLLDVGAALALGAVNRLERSGRVAASGLRVGRALVDRSILRYYARALDELRREGYYRYLSRVSRPYLRAVARHLAFRNVTWTERYFLGRALKDAAPSSQGDLDRRDRGP